MMIIFIGHNTLVDVELSNDLSNMRLYSGDIEIQPSKFEVLTYLHAQELLVRHLVVLFALRRVGVVCVVDVL